MLRMRPAGGASAARSTPAGAPIATKKNTGMETTMAATGGTKLRLGGFGLALLIGWAALGAVAGVFASARHVPFHIALPLAIAFLTEYSFYILPGFADLRAGLRKRFEGGLPAPALAATALLPYLLYSLPTGNFGVAQFALLAAIMTAVAFWFRVFAGASRAGAVLRDLGFLALVAAVILSGVLRWIFPAPLPKLPLEVLGHVSLIRTAILSVLLVRGAPGLDFGFIPRGRDLRIGAAWFAACAVLALPLGWEMGQLHFRIRTHISWQWGLQSIGVVLGIFWVVALSEEFFFRALLQQWLTNWLRRPVLGLLLAAALFGTCHLAYPSGQFPNWRFAILAGVLGLFYGAAYRQAGSMRASMVTHALAAATWRLFLS
jgi:membrane protease YdiL (CAAX protease family)